MYRGIGLDIRCLDAPPLDRKRTMTQTQAIDIHRLLEIIASVSGGDAALHEPEFGGREWEYVKDALDSGWVSSSGSYVDRFESDIGAFTGAKRAVATVTGTAALHIALILAGVEAGDEVIVPALTFVATATAVTYLGAIPHLADIERETLGIDPQKLDEYLQATTEPETRGRRNLETGRTISAVVGMHTFGHPVDLIALVEVCDHHNLTLVEDAAESLGSYYRDKHTGTFGKVGVLSFNGNKIITTGGGGMILTDDEELANEAKHLTTTAKVPHTWRYDHDRLGFNYRLPNLNAALGCAQLEQVPTFLSDKRALAERYAAALAVFDGVSVVVEPEGCKSNYWLNALLLDAEIADSRDELLSVAHESGLGLRPAWSPMHHLPMFRNSPRMDLTTSEDLFRRIVNLPSSARLGRRGR